jgi:hypothetical protein
MAIGDWRAWEDPDDSAGNWLERATAPWREGKVEPTADQLLQAAQVAAMLAIAERLDVMATHGRVDY